ncbi:MAG: family acetyltransferase [Flaviaesturariibacter sp.]|nr:family acetyltransferase [Flaviaesturariibacter sp.]
MALQFRKADRKDTPAIVKLVNSAYRGAVSRQGWTHEADLIDGDIRTDERELSILLTNPNAIILLCFDEEALAGSVYLENKNGHLYLGMLSVDPLIQAKGIGKALLAAAEEHARQVQCAAIEMTVISVRHELINWYKRYGYIPTGEREPFPENQHFGVPKQPLHFVVLRKELTSAYPDSRPTL